MKRAAVLAAAVSLSALGCASSGGPTVSAGAVSTGAGTPASVPLGPPQRTDLKRARELKRVTLVEAIGRRGPEVEAFVSRMLSDVGDRDLFVLTDARLSGASLGLLASEPNGPAAARFRGEWPSDAYLAATVADCSIKRTQFATPHTTPDGYQTMRVTVAFDAECPASLKLVDAEDGHVLASLDVKGTASYKGDSEAGETPAEEDAARDAATRAVKKLRSQLGR